MILHTSLLSLFWSLAKIRTLPNNCHQRLFCFSTKADLRTCLTSAQPRNARRRSVFWDISHLIDNLLTTHSVIFTIHHGHHHHRHHPPPSENLNMAPAVSRSYSQSKISDSFRPSTKSSKPLKQTKQPSVKPVSKTPSPVVASITPQPAAPDDIRAHLNPSDPTLVVSARSIEADRKAPFGTSPRVREKVSWLYLVHAESQNTIHTILRNFDLSPKYGPCVGISRIDRYRRAEKMGLKPPIEVLKILETQEGDRDWNTDLFSQKSAVWMSEGINWATCRVFHDIEAL